MSRVNRLPEEVQRLLRAKNFAFVATIDKDGSPHVTPTWVDTDGKFVLINTDLNRAKARNVRRDPRIAVSLVDSTDPYNGIMIRGKVTATVRGKIAEDHVDALSKKYTGEQFPDKGPGVHRVILKIRPYEVSYCH